MEKEYVQYGVWVSDCCLIVCLCLSVSVCVWFLLVSWLSFHSSKSYPPHTHVRTHRPTRSKKSVSFVRSFVRSFVPRSNVHEWNRITIDRSIDHFDRSLRLRLRLAYYDSIQTRVDRTHYPDRPRRVRSTGRAFGLGSKRGDDGEARRRERIETNDALLFHDDLGRSRSRIESESCRLKETKRNAARRWMSWRMKNA